MTWWTDDVPTPEVIATIDRNAGLRTSAALSEATKGLYGPSPSQLKKALPEVFGRVKISDQPVTDPSAEAFAHGATLWVMDGKSPDYGVWGLNATSRVWVELAANSAIPVVNGWYVKIADMPNADQFELIRPLVKDRNLLLEHERIFGKSIERINKELDDRLAKAKRDQEIRAKEAQIAALDSTTPPPPPPPGTPATGDSWMLADTSYELVALQGTTPVPVDVAWRSARSYQWKLTDDPNAGYRLGGRPGMGPALSQGKRPGDFALPAYVVGQGQQGPGILQGFVMTQLFGPDWARK